MEKQEGWRKASDEELQVIQGMLLDLTKGRMHTDKMSGVASGIGLFFCIAVIYKMCSFLPQMFQIGDITLILAMLVATVMVLFFTWNFGLAFYEAFFMNAYKIFYEMVKKGEFRVLDVELVGMTEHKTMKPLSKRVALPCKAESECTWEKGLKLYQRYMKKE